MAVVEVQCPECGSRAVVKYGRQANGAQRFRCDNLDCERRIFLLQYQNKGRLPEIKRQMVDMALNGSGIRVSQGGGGGVGRNVVIRRRQDTAAVALGGARSQNGSDIGICLRPG